MSKKANIHADGTTLADCPIGMFLHDGVLCLKTEYSTDGRPDAYIVASGEYFWGGTDNTEAANALIVIPAVSNSLLISEHHSTAWRLRLELLNALEDIGGVATHLRESMEDFETANMHRAKMGMHDAVDLISEITERLQRIGAKCAEVAES